MFLFATNIRRIILKYDSSYKSLSRRKKKKTEEKLSSNIEILSHFINI